MHPQKWIFLIVGKPNLDELMDSMNKMGQDGWDVINVLWDPKDSEWTAFFKKPTT